MRPRAALPSILILGLVAACSRDLETATGPDVRPSPAPTAASADSPLADTLARAIALALANDALRQQLRDDLRDSRFAGHALHLRSYLAGTRGAAIGAEAARALGRTREELAALLHALPELELLAPRGVDRLFWTGTGNVVVYGTTLRLADRLRVGRPEPGFTTQGGTVEVPLASHVPFPYLAIRPAEIDYGRDPEALRRSWPRRSGRTIATKPDELEPLLDLDPCNPEGPDNPCPGAPPSTEPGGVLLPSGFTMAYCFGWSPPLDGTTDRDRDGMRDNCEYELAKAFRPMLAMNSADEAPGHEPYWSVARKPSNYPWDGSTVKIFYALSYYRDPGDPTYHVNAHDGDSEFIIVRAHNTNDPRGSVWALDYVVLSAHWGSEYDRSGEYDYSKVEFPAEYRGRPRVWVSWNKHANYRSKSVCNDIANWQDVCDTWDTHTVYRDAEILREANLGNVYLSDVTDEAALLWCFNSRYAATNGRTAQDCFWYNAPYGSKFTGWRGDFGQAVATSYGVPLSVFNF